MDQKTQNQGISMTTIVHVASELFIIAGITYWMHIRSSSLEQKVHDLEKKIDEYDSILNKHASVITSHEQNIAKIADFINNTIQPRVNNQPKRRTNKKNTVSISENTSGKRKNILRHVRDENPIIVEEEEEEDHESFDDILHKEIGQLEKIDDFDSETDDIDEKKNKDIDQYE